MSGIALRVISFKDTVLYKRGFWLSAVALVAAVAAPTVVDRSIFDQPVVHAIPICVLIGFCIYLLQNGHFFSIADQVVDCGDYLLVRRARTEVKIPFSSIAAAEVATLTAFIESPCICASTPSLGCASTSGRRRVTGAIFMPCNRWRTIWPIELVEPSGKNKKADARDWHPWRLPTGERIANNL